MANNPIICFSCSNSFSSNAELVEHFQHFQPSSKLLVRLDWHKSQFQKLFNILQDLLAHREPGLDCDVDDSDDVDQDEPRRLSDEEECTEGNHLVSATVRRKPFKCPVPSCDAKRVRRKQELFRHFSTHYACEEFCPCCSKTFYDGSKFMFHKCSLATSTDRTQYHHKREVVRKKIERHLSFWNTKKHSKGATDPNADLPKLVPPLLLQCKNQTSPRTQVFTEDLTRTSTDPNTIMQPGAALIAQPTLLPDPASAVTVNEFRVYDPQLECLFNNDQCSMQPVQSMQNPLEGFFDSATRNQYLLELHERNIRLA